MAGIGFGDGFVWGWSDMYFFFCLMMGLGRAVCVVDEWVSICGCGDNGFRSGL